MKLLFKFLFFLLAGVFLFSCQKDSSQQNLLKQAQSNFAIDKYDLALHLLDSIQNPKKMDNDSYMKLFYIFAFQLTIQTQ